MRYFLLIFGFTVVLVMGLAGKRGDMSRRPPIEMFPDMDRQPKLRPQTANRFFKNGLSSQEPVPGTIARGSPFEDSAVNTGKIPGTTNWVETIHVDPETHREALELLKSRADKDWTLVDCTSFVLMQRRGIREALTSDHHFEQAGFTALLKEH
jgi:hypothetical protein